MTIIKDIEKQYWKKRYMARYFVWVGFGLLAACMNLMLFKSSRFIVKKDEPVAIVETLVKKNTPAASTALYEKLVENPELIEEMDFGRYETLTGLARLLHQDKACIPADDKSAEEGTRTFSIGKIRYTAYPRRYIIYEKNDGTLTIKTKKDEKWTEKVFKNVTYPVVMSEQDIYFITRNNVFRWNETAEGIDSCNNECSMYPIQGTPFLAIFDGKLKRIVGVDKKDEPLERRIDSLLSWVEWVGDFEPDEDTKIMYKAEKLYISKSNMILIINRGGASIIRPDTYQLDYLVRDVDNDGIDELITSENIALGSNRLNVYKNDTQIMSIKGPPLKIDDLQHYCILNPEKVKSDIKVLLKNGKKEQ